MRQKREFFIDALHIFTLVSLAFAQPLYVLSRNAEFFVAHKSAPVEIILLILCLYIFPPLILTGVEAIAGLVGRKYRKNIHYFFIGTLLACIALVLLNKYAGNFPGTAIMAGSVILGMLTTFAYIRFHEVRKFITILFPAIFIFPYLFLFDSPVKKVVFPEEEPLAVAVKAENPIPIIMVVFDEFPVTSLMDEHRGIDPVRYPNFAALARDSYWFRNATTVSDHTHIAVPAILSGNYPQQNKLPIITDYPNNIFTLLGGSYEMQVYEFMTRLCPERLCGKSATRLVTRIHSLFTDLIFVYLHILLPPDFTSELPEVTRSWKNFAAGEHNAFMEGVYGIVRTAKKEMSKDRGETFREFIRSINNSESPTLYFQHNYLPHTPWNHLPSGKKYSVGHKIKGLTVEQWSDNELFVVEAYQRHLLQVGYVDRLIGEMLERLKTVGIYDNSLIIITTDHGVSFRPNDSRRYVGKTNYQDIMPVPLLIKLPGQRKGMISDRNVETIDILPTIADVINIQIPWPVDGRSVFDRSLPERTEKIIFAKQTAEDKLVYESSLDAKYETLKQKTSLFGSGSQPYGLFKTGPHPELIGRHVSDVEIVGEANVWIQFDNASLFDNVDPKAFLPAYISGRVLQNLETSEPLILAFAVNDKITAISQSFRNEKNGTEISAIVPEEAFRSGKNKVEVFLVTENNNKPVLSRTKNKQGETYTLTSSELVVPSSGEAIPTTSDYILGFLDLAEVQGDNVLFYGWAANVKEFRPVDTIAIFVNGEFLYSGYCNLDRPDLAEGYKNPNMLMAGFKYNIPLSLFKDISNSEVRLFAISKKDLASELYYPKEYKWGTPREHKWGKK
jgi:hypothetical protein